MVEKNRKTPEETIAIMKVELEEKYKKEREVLAEKKKKERNDLRKMERKLKKEEQDKLGKVLYEKYGVKSVLELEDNYELVKKGETVSKVEAETLTKKTIAIPEEKMKLIQSFYKETGEWCLEKQKEGSLKDTSVPNRVANFFQSFYEFK